MKASVVSARATWWLAPIVVGALIRLPGLHAAQLDYDEGVYWASLRSMGSGHRLFTEVFSSQPPAFLTVVRPFYGELGHSLSAARFGVLLFGLLGIGATQLAGRSAVSPRCGRIAATVVAVDPMLVRQNVTLQAETPAVAPGTLALATILAGREMRGSRAVVAAALSGALLVTAILCKLLAVAFGPPILLTILATKSRERWPARLRLLAWFSAGGALAALAFLLPYVGDLPAVWRQSVGLHLKSSAVPTSWTSLGAKLARESAVIALAGAGLVFVIRRRFAARPMLSVWLASAIAVVVITRPLWPHDLAVLVPPLAVLAGVAIEVLMARHQHRVLRLAAIVGAGMAAIGVYGLVHATGTGTNHSVAVVLEARTRPSSLVILDDQYSADVAVSRPSSSTHRRFGSSRDRFRFTKSSRSRSATTSQRSAS